MAPKHLHELLEEEQEPFVLKAYIDERRFQLKRKIHISQDPICHSNPSKTTKKSPAFDKGTASLLFAAALKAQNVKQGLLGSIMRRFVRRNWRSPRWVSSESLAHAISVAAEMEGSGRSGTRLLEFVSLTASSPGHRKIEEQLSPERGVYQDEEEDEKQQLSPVSVLDPPIEEDEEEEGDHHNHHHLQQQSFAAVLRVKQQLLQRISRFERLAELDPVELEKRMAEEDNEGEDIINGNEEYGDECDEFVMDVLNRSGTCHSKHIKRLVEDIIDEERSCYSKIDKETLASKLLMRLVSWKGVELNTIDMMVGMDLERGGDEWRRFRSQVGEVGEGIELAIFEFLVDELWSELACSC
ncbi:hypothetical protein QJS04_geneDACA010099 [Acorus gramineus]|uniref:DUF4378 domain-containing protein n=1 Tax=Acorus gramineus TaxID=55184 RepID=A0AAV9BFB8_ACOGR|nr:hypothetical protein QJS04_geneDACA010099 [Acorus gramineus]